MCYITDTSAFSYVSLRPSCTERVHVLGVEGDGSVICRPTSALRDAAELQQQLQDIYTTGIITRLLLYIPVLVSVSLCGRVSV